MLIAHLPVGYLIAKAKQRVASGLPRIGWIAALVGSVIPDADMIWFWTFDHRQHHHHSYFTHWPIFWLGVWLLGLTLSRFMPRVLSLSTVNLFALATLSHMILDTVAAPIMWLAPISYGWFELAQVPPSPRGAIFAFLTHWTFGLELSLSAIALILFVIDRRTET